MYYYYVIPGALIMTLILTVIISLFFRRPLRGLWIFFFIVFLATWASQLWINPFGPIYWGVAWVPLIVAPIFFWLLILALLPPWPPATKTEVKQSEASSIVLGMFFWIMLIVLLTSIIVGYYRMP